MTRHSRAADSPPPQQVVSVGHNNLELFLKKVNSFNSPSKAIFDLQGRAMPFKGFGHPIIVADNVTLRNGSIELSDRQIFGVEGRDVVLESITVSGGERAVDLGAYASLTMTACMVRDAYTGVHMEDSSILVATRLKVTGCSGSGFSLFGRSDAKLLNCEISGASSGILMHGKSRLAAVDTRMSSEQANVVRLLGSGTVTLSGCTISRDIDT